MMKKKIFIGLAVVVALVAAWIVLFPGKTPFDFFGKKKSAIPDTTPGNSSQATSADTGNAINPDTRPTVKDSEGFPVIYGDTGNNVEAIQEGLNLKFGSTLAVDGIFGPKTKQALSAHGYSDTITKAQWLEIVM